MRASLPTIDAAARRVACCSSVLLLLALGTLVPTDAEASPRLQLNGELGPEIDTNPARLSDGQAESYDNGEQQVTAPLLRAVLGGTLSWQGGRHQLSLTLGGGGKLYLTDDGRSADELVQHAAASWTVWGRNVAGRLSGWYYDAFLRPPGQSCGGLKPPCPARDFRTGRAEGAVLLRHEATQGILSLGYSGLEFKPNGAFSYHGVGAGLTLQQGMRGGDDGADWGLAASYQATVRFFRGGAKYRSLCSPGGSDLIDCAPFGDAPRRDLNHLLRVDVTYLGGAAARLFYRLEFNQSNSFSEGYRRHAIGLEFTSKLLWGVFMTAQLVLQLSSFTDPLFPAQAERGFVSTDQDNRSRLLLHLGRDLGERWSLNLRYAIYVNESGANATGEALPGFVRQTVFLGLRFEYDSSDG